VAAFCFASQSPIFEIAIVVVALDHVARIIINADHNHRLYAEHKKILTEIAIRP
jgi:hypothetical protein